MFTPPSSPADRFALIIDGLCRVIAARGHRTQAPAPVLILLWTRLRRAAARFAVLAAKIQAGTLPSPARRRRRETLPLPLGALGEGRGEGSSNRSEKPRPASPAPEPRLPTSFGWLMRLLPEAACSRSQLNHFLSDPEVAAMVAAAPQTGRILRPLCRKLGIQIPQWLAIVRPPPISTTAASPAPLQASGQKPANVPLANAPSGPPRSPPERPQATCFPAFSRTKLA